MARIRVGDPDDVEQAASREVHVVDVCPAGGPHGRQGTQGRRIHQSPRETLEPVRREAT